MRRREEGEVRNRRTHRSDLMVLGRAGLDVDIDWNVRLADGREVEAVRKGAERECHVDVDVDEAAGCGRRRSLRTRSEGRIEAALLYVCKTCVAAEVSG